MSEIYFPQFQISFTGIDKKIQQQLALCIDENTELLNTIAINTKNYEEALNICICFYSSFSDIKNCNAEKLKHGNTRILCVSDFTDFENLLACIRSGYYGCISIANIYTEIINAIISVLQNRIYVSPAFALTIDSYFKKDNGNAIDYNNLITSREHKLIQLLTVGALYKEIAWKMCISENTVRSHVRNIYSKLKVHSKTELTRKILKGNLITSTIYFLSDYIACLCY